MLIEKILVSAGYHVTGVQDGIAALREARANPPDLVLLDLIIPGVDGYGVCALLKRDRAFRAPVIVLSGRTNDRDIKAALGAGADAFLPKPLDRMNLLTKVAELLAAGPTPENKESP
jgi:DNA-binding response OmpR family regulator